MQREAENHPTDEDHPRPARRELQLPDEPENESGQKGDVGDREVTEGARVHFWFAGVRPAGSKAFASSTISALVRVQGAKNGSTSISGKPRRVISARMFSRSAARFRCRDRRKAS